MGNVIARRRVALPQQNKVTAFLDLWRMLAPEGLPAPLTEYQFAPPRKFRFDIAWPVAWAYIRAGVLEGRKVAVEIEGGLYVQGGHVRGQAYERNLEKYNLATQLGWRLLRYSPGMLQRDPQACIAQVVKVING